MYHCIILYDKLWLAIISYYTVNHYWESFIYKCINWYINLQKKINHQNYVIPCKESCHILWATGPPGQSLVVVAIITFVLWPTTLGHRKTWPRNAGPQGHTVKPLYMWPCMLGHLCFVAPLAGPLKKFAIEAQNRGYMMKTLKFESYINLFSNLELYIIMYLLIYT